MRAAEWESGLAYTLKNSGHGLEQITLASAGDAAGAELIVETARRTATNAGWPVTEISVTDLRRLQQLPELGYLIIRAGTNRLTPEVALAVSAFQHLVSKDLHVALLIVASPKVIRSLRREPALGWLSRADAISEPEI